MGWHKDTVKQIVGKLEGRYLVFDPMNLPEKPRDKALYRPDIVVLERGTNKMVCIIEVETSRVRKVICGAAILANTVLSESRCGNAKIYDRGAKPTLYFVVDDDLGEREREKLERRINLIMKSLRDPQVKEIKLRTKSEFISKNINEILVGG